MTTERTTTANRRLAKAKKYIPPTTYYPIEKTKKNTPRTKSKSLAALPYEPRFAAKHMLFFHRTRFVDRTVLN